jgi:hypothetical protein
MDSWSAAESGGLPVNNAPSEFEAWGKNPQYYIKVTKPTWCYFSLLQPDGRMTKQKFPYAGVTQKASIILSKAVNGKKKLGSFQDTEHIYISPVRQHRENSVFKQLQPGEYIVSLCPLKEGSTGVFCFEINFEDTLADDHDDKNFMSKLANTNIERLGNSSKVYSKLKTETSIEEIKELNEKKKIFMYQQFKTMLVRNDKLTSGADNEKKKKAMKDEDAYF